jgi:hypothetical protein
MFIKTFFDVILADFESVEVVILRRDLSLVLKSFIELGYFSPKNPVWAEWMSSPSARTAAMTCIAPDSEMDQFDLCIAYLFDIEARAARFRKEYPHVPAHDVRLEGLGEAETVQTLFRTLRITPTDSTWLVLGRAVNTREESKKRYGNPTDLAYCRERILSYVERSRKFGISIPETAALLVPCREEAHRY